MLIDIDNEGIRELFRGYPKRAITMLYKYFYFSLVDLSFQYTENREAAEDIAQEAFIVLWEKRVELERNPDTRYRNFLIRVVKFKSIDFYRQERSSFMDTGEFNADEFASRERSMEQRIIARDEVQYAWQLIMTFPKRERECLRFKFEQELSVDAIARILKISRKSVERSLTSAKKRLREHRKANEKK